MQLIFMPLTKADQVNHLVRAYAAVEEPDKAREIMDYATAVPQFAAWSKQYSDTTLGKSLGNIRAMHNPRHLAGKVQEIAYDDTKKSVEVLIKVLDPVDWTKVEEGGYTGLSIGGGYVRKWADAPTGCTRYTPRISEISFVDSPCIPSARIMELQKSDGTTEEVLLKGTGRTFAQLVTPPTFGDLHKANFGKLVSSAVRHEEPHFSDTFVNRGKTFSDLNPAEKVRPSIDREVRGKKLSGEIDKGKITTYTSRGKTFSSGAPEDDSGLERATLVGNLLKRRAGAGEPRRQALLEALAKNNFFLEPDNTVSNWQAQQTDQFYPKNPFTLHQNKVYFPGLAKEEEAAMLMGALAKAAPAPSTPAARAKIHATLHEFKHGSLRSYRGTNPRTGKPRRGPKVTDRQQAIAIALSQARRMGKSEPAFVVALADRMAKRSNASDLHEAGKTARLGPAIGGGMGAALGLSVGGPVTGLAGASVGGAIGRRIQAAHRVAGATKAKAWVAGQLSEKERAQRVAAAKARWAKEGHPAIDDHHQAILGQAKKAILGRAGKVAAVQEQIEHNWHSVADAQAAYDKMRPHAPKQHGIMMEVPHAGGLLYNPEGLGAQHFDPAGKPKKRMYLMHPTEVDDWIAKHGKDAKAVRKEEPFGAVEHIDELLNPVAIAA